jgi:hypothetical protein
MLTYCMYRVQRKSTKEETSHRNGVVARRESGIRLGGAVLQSSFLNDGHRRRSQDTASELLHHHRNTTASQSNLTTSPPAPLHPPILSFIHAHRPRRRRGPSRHAFPFRAQGRRRAQSSQIRPGRQAQCHHRRRQRSRRQERGPHRTSIPGRKRAYWRDMRHQRINREF